MKVWITKYALTQGIEEINSDDFTEFSIEDSGYLVLCKAGNLTKVYNKKDYSLNKESAIHKAEEMRQEKIASLKKQIKKFEEMRFE